MSKATKSKAFKRRGAPVTMLILIVTGVAAAAVVFGLTSGGGSTSPADAADPAKPAEPISYLAWEGSKTESTAQFEGKPLVVNFWAAWCVLCLYEIPGFVRLYEDYNGKVAFLGLNVKDNPEDAAWAKGEMKISYPLGRDPQGEAFRAIDGIAMPTTVLISPDGTVVERISGEVSAGQLEQKIREHIGIGV